MFFDINLFILNLSEVLKFIEIAPEVQNIFNKGTILSWRLSNK
jgi:hypothetical protein